MPLDRVLHILDIIPAQSMAILRVERTVNRKELTLNRTTKDANAKKRFCVQSGCGQEAITRGYCRAHYISNWKLIKFSNQLKAEKRLNSYVDRLVKKYPEDYLERIKEGLENEDKFKETIQELELEDESTNAETETEYLEKLSRNLKIGSE